MVLCVYESDIVDFEVYTLVTWKKTHEKYLGDYDLSDMSKQQEP